MFMRLESNLLKLLLGTAIAITGLCAHAANVTWDGDTDADFGTGTNWAGDVVPGPVDTVVIDNAALPNQPEIMAGDTFTVSAVSNLATLSVRGDLSSTGDFNNGGILQIFSGASIVTSQLLLDGNSILRFLQVGGLVTGNATLDGTLELDFTGVGGLFDGQTFDLIDGSVTGAFDSILSTGLAPGFTVSTGPSGDGRTFQAVIGVERVNDVPEPATGWLLLAALPYVARKLRVMA